LKQRRAATAAAAEAAEAPDLDEMRDELARRINALTERCSGDSGGEEAADDGPAAIIPPAGP
jgi:hypothetical protein